MKLFSKILSIVVIAVALTSCGNDSANKAAYKLKPNPSLEYAISGEDMVSLNDFADMVKFPERYPNVVMIDLRTPDEFDENHIQGAINVPLKTLIFNNIVDELISSDKVNMLYGRLGDNAIEAGLLLKMVGRNNFMVCPADYSFIKDNMLTNYSIHNGVWDNSIARYDYAKVVSKTIGKGVSASKSTAPTAAPIVKRKKKEAGGGGCD